MGKLKVGNPEIIRDEMDWEETKSSTVSFRISPTEKILLRKVFREGKNFRKFLLAVIQDPESRKLIEELIDETKE
jgi:hypothetical protein